MKLIWDEEAWDDYVAWQSEDKKTLKRINKLISMNYNVTNNHAFRMSLNSNVLSAKFNLTAAKRAELLGHSVETNLKYYTFATKDSMDDLVDLFDSKSSNSAKTVEVSPRSHQNVVIFKQKESSEHLISQAF
jgi:Txe/YoeB family toxin of Txe-Axe toxin-antitoxin module